MRKKAKAKMMCKILNTMGPESLTDFFTDLKKWDGEL
jgi:hypothetical protein